RGARAAGEAARAGGGRLAGNGGRRRPDPLRGAANACGAGGASARAAAGPDRVAADGGAGVCHLRGRRSGRAGGGATRADGNWGWLTVPGDWGPAPASIALQRSVKKQFDPRGVLAPERFVV